MAIRFKRDSVSHRSASANELDRAQDQGFGQWWATVAILSVTIVGVLSLGGHTNGPGKIAAIAQAEADVAQDILGSLQTSERALLEIEENLSTLCQEPVLVALELQPDCTSGTMTLEDDLFTSGGGPLTATAREDVVAAITAYLEQLRQMPAIWEGLEALEIRGHSDPRAFRNAYQTNLVGSQQRALGVLLFLVGPGGLAAKDREDLERLATVSGASFSRPPASCPEQTRDCYPEWRRVEIRPVLSEELRRGDWSRSLESVRVAARRIRERSEAAQR